MLPIYPRVWADSVYRADTEKLFAECADRDVGLWYVPLLLRNRGVNVNLMQ